MTGEYPGSTKVVSWKKNLPEYISIKGGKVKVEVGETASEAIRKYNSNDVARAVVDLVYDFHSSRGEDLDDFLEENVEEKGKEVFASKVEDVEHEL